MRRSEIFVVPTADERKGKKRCKTNQKTKSVNKQKFELKRWETKKACKQIEIRGR